MARKKVKPRKEKDAGIFIPGGLFVGMGAGFLYGNLPAGLFLGLGLGFILFGATMVWKK